MATPATTGSSTPPPLSSSYRLKFEREEFLDLLTEAKPARLYKVRDFIYFNYDGFVMYCQELTENDLVAFKIYQAIEFSNTTWTKAEGGLFG